METRQVDSPVLGRRFREALSFAFDVHASQIRAGSEAPYVGHLLGVAALVIEDGGSEDEAIAALLHDAAENQGGEDMIIRISEWLGDDVARIVRACSDTLESPKPPWRERKEDYLSQLERAEPDELRVALADKLYNARSIVMNHRRLGAVAWGRFYASRDEMLWYYRSLSEIFLERAPGPLADELAATLAVLEARVADEG